MNRHFPALLGSLILGIYLFSASAAHAVQVVSFGRPVTGIGSNEQAVPDAPALEGNANYNPSTGVIRFYIPTNSSSTGVFGVTPVGNGNTAGTTSDSGTGVANALSIFLRFDSIAPDPFGVASLVIQAVDLDLIGVNDPNGFYESVRFYGSSGNVLTPTITALGQNSAGGNGELAFNVTGNSAIQSILFPDVSSILTGLAGGPLFVELRFSSAGGSSAPNTLESLRATLTTETVPEPGTLALLGGGLLLGAAKRRRRGSRAAV